MREKKQGKIGYRCDASASSTVYPHQQRRHLTQQHISSAAQHRVSQLMTAALSDTTSKTERDTNATAVSAGSNLLWVLRGEL
ncbi:hypothetical protein ACOMHN_060972 [Nucella lapillus]